MDQSTENDDDVIVMPMDAPSITEILDDDEEEEAAAAAAGGEKVKSPRPQGEDSNGDASQDMFVDTSNIKMPMPGVLHIKAEPKDDGYRDEEDDAFMDVGTIEPIDETMEEEEDQHREEKNGEDAATSRNGEPTEEETAKMDTEAAVVQPEDEETILTVDTSEEATRQSPETIALDSPMTPASGLSAQNQQQHELGLDGSVEMLESLEESVKPVVTIVPNKIKINISKLASASLQAEGNTDSRDSVHSSNGLEGAGGGVNDVSAESKSRVATPEVEILYELKESMKGASFSNMGKVVSGIETSGLCSIM